ncbi:hypothetical protein E2C01_096200 [Portunus trituberculatus]|uniref:Uncharacterized protein n=1 Tax=Portunus trituberculatus TaxID=210409 RepID=A0A5B7K2E6_PORTR|nr:hypothetical protein [Portunus trituberculatus]
MSSSSSQSEYSFFSSRRKVARGGTQPGAPQGLTCCLRATTNKWFILDAPAGQFNYNELMKL